MVDEPETNKDGTTTVYHVDKEGDFSESGQEDTYQACKSGIPAGEVWAYTLNTPPGECGSIWPSKLSVDIKS